MSDQLSLFGISPKDEAPRPKTVTQLTAYIRQIFELDEQLQDVWVEGEISNFKRAASGHLYFSLKDVTAQINCVIWKTAAQKLRFDPKNGDRVQAHGYVNVYEPQGAYQLYADLLQPVGMGDLMRQFELLKVKLEAEGLFDSENKRDLPQFPRRIGIVTSPDTAALRDVLNVLTRRYPSVEVILSPTPVQGTTAPPLIVAAIEALNRRADVDVMLVVRGGGSMEDLWCFNDEPVVRAVVNSRIPTIAGVGHEIDFTLVDFAADYRAPTPSAAAEVATPDSETLIYSVQDYRDRMKSAVQDRLEEMRQQIEREKRTLRLLSPANKVATLRQKLDDHSARMLTALQNNVKLTKQQLQTQSDRLNAANPHNILQRGYAIVTRDGDGLRMNSVQQAAPGTTIRIQMQDGELKATVKERKANDSESR